MLHWGIYSIEQVLRVSLLVAIDDEKYIMAIVVKYNTLENNWQTAWHTLSVKLNKVIKTESDQCFLRRNTTFQSIISLKHQQSESILCHTV